MTATRTNQRSFAGGVIAPELYGRSDIDKYQSGLAVARNAIILPHGPVQNRAGFEYVLAAKFANRKCRLIRFAWSSEQTMVLEMGHQYIRFHTNGATLLEDAVGISAATLASPGVFTSVAHGLLAGQWVFLKTMGGMSQLNGRFWLVNTVPTADTFTLADVFTGVALNTSLFAAYTGGGVFQRVYEVTTGYDEADLFAINYVQNADVLTLVHPSYSPRELRRLAPVNWSFVNPSFAPALAPPGAPTAVATGTGGTPSNQEYVITAVSQNGIEESFASVSATCSNDLTVAGHYNTITWPAVTGASRYFVYKNLNNNSIFAYVGVTDALTFKDNNIIPDIAQTPPIGQSLFATPDNFPGAVSYVDQRRVFAGTNNNPQTVWFTRNGSGNNMTASVPTAANDAFNITLAGREINRVRHLLSLNHLLALTISAEWNLSTGSGDPIAPATITAKPQTFVGASTAQPLTAGQAALYVQATGGRLRESSYAWQTQTYNSDDISVMAPHLFDGYAMVDMAFMRGPVPIVWITRDDGVLLSMTYLPEQKVRAWSNHDSAPGAKFESCSSVPEGNEDVLYAVVQRTIGGTVRRYVERLHSRQFVDPAAPGSAVDAFFVDAGLTYAGAATTTLGGLWHLEGEKVAVLADGCVKPLATVTAGTVTLANAASKAHVGLTYTFDAQTLPMAIDVPGLTEGQAKNVTKIFLRVQHSRGVWAGPTTSELHEYPIRTTELYGSPPQLVSGGLHLPISPSWALDGAICIRQTDPLPLTLLSTCYDVSVATSR